MENKMFCFQCQETARNQGCTVRGVCGKKPAEANMMDLLIYVIRGISYYANKLDKIDKETGEFIMRGMFSTITNVNFSEDRIYEYVKEAFKVRDKVAKKAGNIDEELPEQATWYSDDLDEIRKKAEEEGVLTTENED
ncbi:MAG TPA: hypothetical protein VKN74_01220, partial [Candidatus Mcinerneyibacterium sp.]|nr:hypothetical protein [Candidatus Mcinerneyibacterium sp.]